MDASRKIISAGHGLALVKLEKVPELLNEAMEKILSANVPVSMAPTVVDSVVTRWGLPLYGSMWNSPKFDHQESCTKVKCPNRIYAKNYNGEEHPYCVNPSCWKEKQLAAEEEEQEKRFAETEQQRRQQLAEKGVPPEKIEKELKKLTEAVDLSKLEYSDYATFDKYNTKFDHKKDCRGCEQYRLGRHSHGGTEYVCLDKTCFEKKNRAAQALINKESRQNKKSFEALKDQAIEFRGDDPGKREWVFIIARVLQDPPYSSEWSREKIKKAFYKKYGWPQPEQNWSTEGIRKEQEQLIQHLEALTFEELQLALLWLMAKPATEKDFFTQWWLKGLPKQEHNAELDEDPAEDVALDGEMEDRRLHPNVSWILHCSCDDVNHPAQTGQGRLRGPGATGSGETGYKEFSGDPGGRPSSV